MQPNMLTSPGCLRCGHEGAPLPHQPDLRGVQCPDCQSWMHWSNDDLDMEGYYLFIGALLFRRGPWNGLPSARPAEELAIRRDRAAWLAFFGLDARWAWSMPLYGKHAYGQRGEAPPQPAASREALLTQIRRALRTCSVLSRSQFRDLRHGLPSLAQVEAVFGSWEEATRQAGGAPSRASSTRQLKLSARQRKEAP